MLNSQPWLTSFRLALCDSLLLALWDSVLLALWDSVLSDRESAGVTNALSQLWADEAIGEALVLPRPLRDGDAPSSGLRLPVEHARSLLILLRQQLAELDKSQPRSRRSGRS